MVHKSDVASRRILTFPAVHPCEDISPSTLLASLTSLSTKIGNYKRLHLSANKKNAHEAIRLVGVLQIFLEEIRATQMRLSDQVLLSLSELHLVFQKLLYLLEDCSKEGCRLLILMKSEYVSNFFRVLIRSISTALDVMQLKGMDLSDEVEEMVELVRKQASKAAFDLDEKDVLSLKKVQSILVQFENRVVPDGSDLRWILDHLEIRSWSQCNQEINFLDSEIGQESPNEEEKEISLLSSLMAFMCYCRCVVFDVVDKQVNTPSENGVTNLMTNCLNAEDFRCPISLEIMADPVAISTGHTYDRSSITKWFKAGNPTCPKTGERVQNKELVPNVTLRRLIRQYCFENGIPFSDCVSHNRDIKRKALLQSAAAEESMKMVSYYLNLKLCSGDRAEKNKAAYEIRLLSKFSISNRACLAEAGTIPHLLDLASSVDSAAQENAIAALLNLSKHSKCKTIIVENGGLALVLNVLRMGLKVEAKQHAAAVLFYLSSIEEYRKAIGEVPEAIPALLDMIKDGTGRGKKNALVTIFGLLMHPNNHWKVLAAGTVDVLISLLKSEEREDLFADSLAILSTLAERPGGAIAILLGGVLSIAVGILNSSSSRIVRENCVSILLALCVNCGGEVTSILAKDQCLVGSLYSLLTDGTSRASKKARSLIRILHEFHERTSSRSNTPALPQERYIHAW